MSHNTQAGTGRRERTFPEEGIEQPQIPRHEGGGGGGGGYVLAANGKSTSHQIGPQRRRKPIPWV